MAKLQTSTDRKFESPPMVLIELAEPPRRTSSDGPSVAFAQSRRAGRVSGCTAAAVTGRGRRELSQANPARTNQDQIAL